MISLLATLASAQVPIESTQLITAWSADTESSHAELQRWEKVEGAWVAVGSPAAVRLGKSGLAWGRGLHPPVSGERPKMEGDNRAPMGIFDLGVAFSELTDFAPTWPTLRTGPRDLWVEDPTNAAYNTHIRVPEDRPMTEWEQSQRMHLDDDAHRLKLVVAHNAAPPEPGKGSAIFLHVWRRGGQAPTAGCTAMPAESLQELILWLDSSARPVYALLSRDAWTHHAVDWGLPPLPPVHTSEGPAEVKP